MEKKKIRLQKYLSACGITSRRKAEELIVSGHVRVNGEVARIGMGILPGRDKVTVAGKPVYEKNKKIYLALNKPRGFVTTLSDELGRKCITALLSGVGGRVYPIGRLDKDSEGLLLLTNDGEFSNALTHPRHHVPKIYHVSVRPGVEDAQLKTISEGMEIDGKMTAPAKAVALKREKDRAVMEITLFEGRNRQIRKMCDKLDLEIARLSRVCIGNVKLGGLKPGTWRELEPREVRSLLKTAGVEHSIKEG